MDRKKTCYATSVVSKVHTVDCQLATTHTMGKVETASIVITDPMMEAVAVRQGKPPGCGYAFDQSDGTIPDMFGQRKYA